MTCTVASILASPGASVGSHEKINFLQQQLDSLDMKTPMIGDSVLLGSGENERRLAGVLRHRSLTLVRFLF